MNKVDALVVNKIKGIGNKSQVALFEFCRANNVSSFEDLRAFDLTLLAPLKRVAKPLLTFLDSDDYLPIKDEVSGLLEKWSALSIEVIIYGSAEYPTQLTELGDPPAFLFCKGDKTLLTDLKSIAVVGTRENTRVGKMITTKTVSNFVSNGYCIVSGLAIGIDTIAHQATIDSSGKTIAVLVDIEQIYPSKNKDLANLILKSGGLLVAENPPNTNVIPAFFAKRDRIQAGLSLAVFAIETSMDGGTMHAVKTANNLKRNVYVPNAVAAGYSDLSDTPITGTQMLAESGRAIAYTKDSYLQIQDHLEGLLNASLEPSREPDLFS